MAGNPSRFMIPPEPMRYQFDSDDQFQKAKAAHATQKKSIEAAAERDARHLMATMIAGLILIFGALMVFLFVAFGWRGPVGFTLLAGLWWAIYSRIHGWL